MNSSTETLSGGADIFLAITFLCNCGMSFVDSDAKFGFQNFANDVFLVTVGSVDFFKQF